MLTKHTLLVLLNVSLLLPKAATAMDLEQPKPTVEFNYSNGEIGHHVTGLSSEEAGDIQLNEDPLPAPVPYSAELKTGKDLPEKLDGREKQKGRQ